MDMAKISKLEHKTKVILIPTIAGTGSEVSRYSVFVNESNEKETIVSEKLLPDVILYDPTLLTTLPKFVRWVTTYE